MAEPGAWDDEDFEPQAIVKVPVSDKWEGEDEEDVKDNWDDEDEEKPEENADGASEDGATEDGSAEVQATQVKKKKSLRERIAEKEAKRKAELEAARQEQEEEEKEMSAEERLAEKLRQQKLQEESDLELAKDAFGISNDELAGRTGIDAMDPKSKEDFEEFANALKEKILKYESSGHYLGFLEILYRDLTLGLEAEDVKKLSSTLTAVANEKTKAQKASGKKKKGKKATVKLDREEDNLDDGYNEFDDFL